MNVKTFLQLKLSLGFLSFIVFSGCSQNNTTMVDTLEFQAGYPNSSASAIQQLKSFPSPRYKPNNSFTRLFNWMNPNYMGGGGQADVTEGASIKNGEQLQEELILNWNYMLFIPNSNMAARNEWCENPSSKIYSYIKLANKFPGVPLGITTFWSQMNPAHFGYDLRVPNILRTDLSDKYYVKDASGKVIKRVLNFAAPDSLFINDGKLQRICFENIIQHLHRPIDFINENGEEPPGVFSQKNAKHDADVIDDKEKSEIKEWDIYFAEKKKHYRTLYSSQFMDSIPELKNTKFSFYAIEGGPEDRLDWHASKVTNSKIKNNYYSTPDFYPRVPKNWMEKDGAWHGWKWINDGRSVEIADGDKFFSPFIAAGWATNPEEDMRPAQWLGLLKCMSVVGAEFYYVCYFNLKKPFSKPENYVWQAAIPAYAQAIATHYADVFFNGNVLMDEKNKPIVTFPSNEKDVLVTIRKLSEKEKYVIATTVQPTSNTKTFSLQKNIEINLEGEKLMLNARRQGSVYVYDKSVLPPVFYQLDKWHQYEHPERWRNYWINEAEVFDTSSTSGNNLIHSDFKTLNNKFDFTNFQSFVALNKNDWVAYSIDQKDFDNHKMPLYVMLYVRCSNAIKTKIIFGNEELIVSDKKTNDWRWLVYPLNFKIFANEKEYLKIESLSEGLEVDKIIINDAMEVPDLSGY